MNAEPEILFDRHGVAGVVTLNRPRALNALTHGMVQALARQLAAWQDDPSVKRVVVRAAGERAFCAGGDIRALHDLGRAGRHDEALRFWADEYRLNAMIKRYSKPYIALIDGMVMGGGVGISVHGTYRIAGDKFVFAMPEVGIGFFPDVGATWFLPRMPAETGTFCALTGERLKAADAIGFGIATHRVGSTRFPALYEALGADDPVDDILASFAEPLEPGPLMARVGAIEYLFAGDTFDAIMARLDEVSAAFGQERGFAAATEATILAKSPTSLKVTLAQLRRGKALTFEDCMRLEYRIVSRMVHGHDFYEGVRAVIIDKDNQPAWQPARLRDVSDAAVDAYFAPLEAELEL